MPAELLPNLKGRGGPGRGQGRKPGQGPGKAFKELRDLAQGFGDAAIRQTAKMAGLLQKTDKDGKPMFDAAGEPIFWAGATSEQARLTALNMLIDRGYGKASQPLANDPENPLTDVEAKPPPTFMEIVELPVGTPLNENRPVSDEDTDPDEGEEEAKAG